MRTLKFIVDKQLISKDPECDFSGLVPGSEGYIQAKFSFSPEWSNCVKAAAFYSIMGKEYTPQLLKDGYTCVIPAEALENKIFKIQVIGKRENYKITTNKVTVNQKSDN